MRRQRFWIYLLTLVICVGSGMAFISPPAQAAVDPYITRYLRVTEPIPLDMDEQGKTRLFSVEELSLGKQLFERNCLNCHVGGTTLSDPAISLSISDLHGATPRRDTIEGLIAYFRHPMTYDGSEETVWCREVPDTWLSQSQVESLAGFVLRAAQTAPGWGTETFRAK